MPESRDELIIKEYLEQKPVPEIGREYGLGERRIYQILTDAGVRREKVPRRQEFKPIDAVHKRIGQDLYDFYFLRGMDRRAAANKLGWSTVKLKYVEKGATPLGILELQHISSFMRISIQELIDGR